MLIYTHCWELMNSVGSHSSLSLPFVMKVMVCHFVSNSHEVMTALIVVLPLIVVVEISLQLHQSFENVFLISCMHPMYWPSLQIHIAEYFQLLWWTEDLLDVIYVLNLCMMVCALVLVPIVCS